MGLDLGASFRITAGVVGQAAVDKLNAGINTLDEQVSGLPTHAKAAGLALAGLGAGLSIAVLKDKFDGVVESILKVKDASETTGSSIAKIGAIVQAAKITGDDFGQIEAGIVKMNKSLAGSDDEAKGAAHALDAIGLSIKDLRSLDPADAFDKIAKKLDEFEDGGAKSALAMDIFGKSGAQLLPFMKDYVEIGDQVSKVTQEQADQAESYDRNVRKLTAAKQELYKVISTAVLPVANDMLKAWVDVQNGTNGVKDAAKKLAADGSITSWAEVAVKGLGYVLSAGEYIIRMFQGMGKTIAAAAAQVSTLFAGVFESMEKLASGDMSGAWKALQNAKNNTVAVGEAWKEDLKSLVEAKTFGQQFIEQFEARRSGQVKDAEEKNTKKRSLSGYTSRTPTLQQNKSDPFGDAMNNLGEQRAKLQWQIDHIEQYSEKLDSAKEAQIRFDTEQGKFKDLAQSSKDKLIEQAKAVDDLTEKLRLQKEALEVEKQTKALAANTAAMGLNTRGRELAAFAQDLENKGIKEGTDLYDKLTESRKAALDAKDAARADPFLGIKEGLAEIGDKTKDVATGVKDALVNAFDSASDALTTFVTTGKLDFASFAKSVIADLVKMIIKQQLFNALSGATSSLLGLAGGSSAAAATTTSGTASVSTFAALGAAFAGGTRAFAHGGIVDSPTNFRFATGGAIQNGLMGEAGPEAIVPLKRGKDGKLGISSSGGQSSGGVSIGSIVVQNNGDASAQDTSGKNSAAMGKALAAAVQAEIVKQQRPGGLLAA